MLKRLRPDVAASFVLLASLAAVAVAPPPIAVVGALAFVLAAWVRLDLALLAPMLLCPFYLPVDANPLPPRPVGSLAFSMLEISTVLCLIAWLGRWLRSPGPGERPRFRSVNAWLPALAFVGAAALAAGFAEYRQVALRELRVVVVEPVLYGLMVVSTFDRAGVGRFTAALVFLAALVGLFSIYHYLVIGIVEATGGVRRVLAIYHSPNQLALLLDRLVPAAFALALPSSKWEQHRWWPAAAGAFLLAVIALILTYSRGAWLAVGGGLFLIATVWSWRAALAVAGALIVAVVAALTRLDPGRLFSQQTSLQRPTIWSAAWRMIGDHPIVGVGPDNFLYYYRDRGYLPPEGWAEPDISHPHNLVLDAWLRTGIGGLITLGWAVFVYWQAFLGLVRSGARSAGTLRPALALAGGMVAALLHALFDNGYFLPDLATLFWGSYAAMLVLASSHNKVGEASGQV